MIGSANTQYAIRNTQYVGRLKAVCEWGCQYAIRNTQYANHLKVDCVIRNCLPQYATSQYVTYTVVYTSHLSRLAACAHSVRLHHFPEAKAASVMRKLLRTAQQHEIRSGEAPFAALMSARSPER